MLNAVKPRKLRGLDYVLKLSKQSGITGLQRFAEHYFLNTNCHFKNIALYHKKFKTNACELVAWRLIINLIANESQINAFNTWIPF